MGRAELHFVPNAEQTMGMPAERTRRWTAREVRHLIANQKAHWPRYELVDGELLVTPAPRAVHQMAVGELFFALAGYCRASGVGTAMMSPADIELEPEDVRQPDVFVLPIGEGRRILRDGWPGRSLILAAQVLSPSTARFDRVVKRPKYQRLVSEYWIVDTDARVIERWRPNDERPEIVSGRLTWSPPGVAEPFVLELDAFFARVFLENESD